MSGLSNYARHSMLRSLVGLAGTPALTTYVALLTALPTTDGDSGGGTLSSVGAVEWTLARKLVNTEASATSPYWLRASGVNGGWKMSNSGVITWSAADTTALSADTTILGVAVYDALTGGNLWAWEPLDQERVAVVGQAVEIGTTKIQVRMFGDVT